MKLFYKIESDYTLEETLELIRSTITSANFTILAEFNLSDKLRANNLPYSDELIVMEVCNPSYAYAVLNTKANSKFLLPCRITINKGKRISVGIMNYEAFDALEYSLSDAEQYVLNEIKQAISVVEKKNKLNIN